MNWLVTANGITYLCAGIYSFLQGHYLWSGVWFCYGVSALILSVLEGK